MLRSILTHLLVPGAPGALATALAWPAFGTEGRAALLGLIAASLAIGCWQLLRAARRTRALNNLTMQVEDLVNGEEPVDSQAPPELATLEWTEALDDDLQALTEQLDLYVAAIAEAAAPPGSGLPGSEALASEADGDHAEPTDEALRFEAYEPAPAPEPAPIEVQAMETKLLEAAAGTNAAVEATAAATRRVDQGCADLQRLIAAVAAIEASRTEANRAVRTIEDVATESHLLAVNAAVEATRAGTEGRGFQVIADEIENLSRRGAEAAKRTSAWIEAMQERAHHGGELAATTDAALRVAATSLAQAATALARLPGAEPSQAQPASGASAAPRATGSTGSPRDGDHDAAPTADEGETLLAFDQSFDDAFR